MDLLICRTCGTQHDAYALKSCKICDDPRQYVPPEGQSFTTLRELRESGTYRNVMRKDPFNSNLVSIWTEPQVAIGQRAMLVRTAQGNLLWDCITYLDDDTVARVNELGGISAIVISHPHYYSTCLEWAQAFSCPVYLSSEEEEWVMRPGKEHVFVTEPRKAFMGGECTLVKVGGHFPGSSVLYWRPARKLLIADSLMVVPSGRYFIDRPVGTVSFTFMWSYPNMIPLDPDSIMHIWQSIADLDFDDCHGAWWGKDACGNAKKRVLDSAQIIVRAAGHPKHPLLQLKG